VSEQNQPSGYVIPPDKPPAWKIPTLFGLVAALIAGNAYQFYKIGNLEKDIATTREGISSQIAQLRETETVSAQTHRRTAEALKEELAAARKQASQAAGQAKVDAIKRSEELASRLKDEQTKAQQETKAEITQVREVASTATTKIGEVSTEVGNVKTELGSTKTELQNTIANLRRVTGDVSGQASLIATNSSEINALKALGDRNIFEFNIHKAKEPQKVGDIALVLKKTDQKKNKFTIDVLSDDTRVEKKDRGINEPIQFMTSKARQPYEVVVNKVNKDQIAGYLATPKVQSNR
jgi:hypothetical protein